MIPLGLLSVRERPRLVSLVLPVFNEEDSLPLLRKALSNWAPSLPCPIEIILVDDGSSDRSLQLLRSWSADDKQVRVLSFSRNFGHQIAVMAGLHHTRGDAVVILDADLQDPLEVISEMITRFQEGYDIVYGRRQERRGETWAKKTTAWLFYRLMRMLVHRELPPDTGDFRLVSARCVEALRTMPEGHLFLRGLFAWMGFRQTSVSYVRHARSAGTTKYNYRKMVGFAANAALSFSPLPIRAIALFGAAIACGGFVYALYSAARWLVVGDTVAGWPTLVILVTVLGGMNLVCLGVIGEYISRIYEETKRRPLYLIKESINLAP
jgi:dolichol-phosphate mannosyltransferase